MDVLIYIVGKFSLIKTQQPFYQQLEKAYRELFNVKNEQGVWKVYAQI